MFRFTILKFFLYFPFILLTLSFSIPKISLIEKESTMRMSENVEKLGCKDVYHHSHLKIQYLLWKVSKSECGKLSLSGKTLDPGEGFCKSDITVSIQNRDAIEKDDVVITESGDGLSGSAVTQPVKKLNIQPPNPSFFLYIDSETSQAIG